MTELWHPTATRELATSNAGPFTGGAPKALLHTTEGHRYADALAVYRNRGYWPHATATFERGRVDLFQHLPLNLAGKALEHPPGTGATNTDTVIQIELVGSADPDYAHRNGLLYVEDWPDAYLAGVADWIRFVHDQAAVPLVAPFPFARPGLVRRPTWQQWHSTAGVYGHCHVPANTHTDPGAINISRILEIANGGPAPMPNPAPPEVTNVAREVRLRGGGVWKLLADGGVFTDKGAPYFGSMGGQHLNAPAVALVPTPTEAGYWIVAADGGIFAFGDAHPIAPYAPLMNEYGLGIRHVVDAAATAGGLELVSNRGELYDLDPDQSAAAVRPKLGGNT